MAIIKLKHEGTKYFGQSEIDVKIAVAVFDLSLREVIMWVVQRAFAVAVIVAITVLTIFLATTLLPERNNLTAFVNGRPMQVGLWRVS